MTKRGNMSHDKDQKETTKRSNATRTISPGRLLFYARIPVESHVVKKNSKKIKTVWDRNSYSGVRRYIGGSDRQKYAEEFLVSRLWGGTPHFRLDSPLSDPLWCVFNFQYSERSYYTKKGLVNKNLPDLSNLYELPQDALQKARIIQNDSLIKSHDYSRMTVGSDTSLEIFIFLYQEETDKAYEFFRKHRILGKNP